MSSVIPKGDRKYTFAEYMAMEEKSIEKHDYYYGEVFAMAGGTANHHQIGQNINAALLTRFKPDGCFISLEAMRLELGKENFYLYPDIFVTCDERDKKNTLFKQHPAIVFEVLSDSTALYDKEVKLKYYKRIEGLNYYVLVSQKEVMVEVYSRINDTQIWKYQTFEVMNEIIEFERLGFALPVATIYEGISLGIVE